MTNDLLEPTAGPYQVCALCGQPLPGATIRIELPSTQPDAPGKPQPVKLPAQPSDPVYPEPTPTKPDVVYLYVDPDKAAAEPVGVEIAVGTTAPDAFSDMDSLIDSVVAQMFSPGPAVRRTHWTSTKPFAVSHFASGLQSRLANPVSITIANKSRLP